ncbi:Membrane dipeptidase (Peptidase family M19) [Rubripirellula lacrimiformis]|uniref:Membrane dipeptidase (Peptidase family M19) n=1 Tax=Rubripirellula lacrimiformis TaxID=1930273 RepID=A0A517NF39_9BACT|nr:membrane dipeptidase [Rubripirellula lacrimiformis]QDT05668.1 Membrane dipeptidase (Peptidase family M19) [Rubripirellula lacrimiformis]
MIFDAHLDLSLNAMEYNRDLRQSVSAIRKSELGMGDLKGRGAGTVCFPEMRQADIAVCVATQLGGCMKPAGPVASWNSPAQAWAMTQGQLAWYRAMEDDGQLRQIRTAHELTDHLQQWKADSTQTPIGYILSLEGADSIRTLDDLETAYAYGLRALGPAHYGIGRYALGHDQNGPLSPDGQSLIRKMDQLGMILDVTHLCDESFVGALDLFDGPVWASHHNSRTLVDDPRQLSDQQVRALAQRDAVIGVALDAWMMVPGWVRGSTTPASSSVSLRHMVDHIDHFCQLLGDTRHVGIGTDLDGGYGTEQTPQDLDTIADLVKVGQLLSDRGYSDADIDAITHRNFVDHCTRSLPKT